MMKTTLLSSSTAALAALHFSLLAAPAAAAPAVKSDAGFVALANAEYKWRHSQMAAGENQPKAGLAARLPRVDEATQQAKLAYWQTVKARLHAIDPAKLSPRRAQDYAVFRFQIDTLIEDQLFKTYQRPLTGDTSFWSDLTEMSKGQFHTEVDYRNYLSQLSDFPRYFQENIDNMRAGLKRGFTLPKVVLQGRDATVISAISGTPESNPYYAPFKTMPVGLPAAVQARLRLDAAAAIRERVVPAHQALLAFLRDDYVPGAASAIAAYDLPDGKAFYRAQIIQFTTLDLSPEHIHSLGIAEVTKIKAEMQAVMDQVGFKGELKAFNNFLRTDAQFYARTPQDLLDRAAWIAKRFDAKAAAYFGRLPRQRFGIYPVAADVAPFYTTGRGGPGVYYVNTYDLPSRPLFTIPALTLHEAAPGHAFQMPLAAENTALPQFRRDLYISAYGEGWALYCERLGEEMGMYGTPYEHFGMLTYQMWRAARLVVDTGIHSGHWTREQARQYLLDNTALSEHEVTTEVDRYIAWPGQALSYYLGEMHMWENRRKAEKALGPKFDIRNFHDAVLQLGSVPLPVLGTHIDQFILSGGKGPYHDQK